MTHCSVLGRAKSEEKADDLSITVEHYQCITVSEISNVIDCQSVDKTDNLRCHSCKTWKDTTSSVFC